MATPCTSCSFFFQELLDVPTFAVLTRLLFIDRSSTLSVLRALITYPISLVPKILHLNLMRGSCATHGRDCLYGRAIFNAVGNHNSSAKHFVYLGTGQDILAHI